MSSECFASWATSPSCNPSSSGKQSTLVKKVIEFLHANLCEACVDSAYGYGFLDGTEERKEDFIEQFTTLNSKCLVRSTTHVKERSQKIIRKRYFQSSLLFLFAIFGKTKTTAQNRGRIKAGHARVFMFILQNNLTFCCPFFFGQRREITSHLWSPEATSMFSCRNETEILCRSNSIKFSNQVARILISVIIRKQLSTASVPHVR